MPHPATLMPIPAALVLAAPSAAQDALRPNVVLLMSDDQGWGDAGYQGHPTLRTPHLDAMARSGVRFDRFYAGAPVCSPTRGSCLTGRHPSRYGILGANVGHVPASEDTLAEILHAHGYRTGHFGKWHLGTLTTTEKDSNRGRPGRVEHYAPPWEHGFDVAFSTEAKVPTFDPMLTPGRPGVPYGTWYWTGPGRKAGDAWSWSLRGDDSRLIMDRALPFIESSVAAGRPFLAVIWFHAPHLPVRASERHQRPYAGFDRATRHYYGCLSALDVQIGRLRARLRELGVVEDTMVWYCSDNGPEGRPGRAPGSAGPLRGRKRSLYEGGVRVPGILEWPRRVPTPRTVAAPCSTLDYVPSILDALGIEPRLPLDGISLWPLIDGRRRLRRTPIPFAYKDTAVWMEDRLKLVRREGEPPRLELYDIVADPGETDDLAPSRPDDVARMSAALAAWRASCAGEAATTGRK